MTDLAPHNTPQPIRFRYRPMRADVLVEVLERFKKRRQQQFVNVEGNEHTSTFKDPKKIGIYGI